MHRDPRRRPIAIVLFVLLIAASVGFVSYRAGVSHGIAMNLAAAGVEAAKAAPNAQAVPYAGYPYPYPYGWHGPWGWGLGFFPFGFFIPFLFFGLWFFALRALFWGGPWGHWRRGWYDGHRHDDDAPSRRRHL